MDTFSQKIILLLLRTKSSPKNEQHCFHGQEKIQQRQHLDTVQSMIKQYQLGFLFDMMNIQVYAQLSMQKKIQLTSFVVKFVMECAPGETGEEFWQHRAFPGRRENIP